MKPCFKAAIIQIDSWYIGAAIVDLKYKIMVNTK